MTTKFTITETIGTTGKTMRLGADATPAGRLNDKDVGKIVGLAGESRYDISAVGAPIETFILAVDVATSDGFSTGSLREIGLGDVKKVVFEGKQADGTGALAIGDYVVTGTQGAKGVKDLIAPKVRKATDQAAAAAAPFKWRVVSLGVTGNGNGAVGTTGYIERV